MLFRSSCEREHEGIIVLRPTLFFWDADDPQGGEAFDEVAYRRERETRYRNLGKRTVLHGPRARSRSPKHLGHCCESNGSCVS